jgi:hypothetical protein
MCQPTTCRTCGKTTWKGCGDHVESVRVQVPPDQWCPGPAAHQDPGQDPATTVR